MKTILFVDDDAQILNEFTNTFIDSDYTVFCVDSGLDALIILAAQSIDIVVCDLRMPDMDGIELLKRIKKNYPSAIRMVMGSQSDEKMVMNCLMDNIAKAHLFKPWDDEKLKKTIKQVLDTEELMSSKEMMTVINNIGRLPTLKPFYQDILNAIEKDTDISAISAEIEKDPAISAKILQMANSAYYGVKTGSVQIAAAFLGTQNLKNLVLTTSIMDSLTLKGSGNKVAQDVWNHASYTNKIQRVISENILFRKHNHTECTAGLLHNLGIVFMIKQYPNDYIAFLKDTANVQGINLLEQEKNRYGITHAEVGGYLLQWWDLPFAMVESALYHGEPQDDRIINKELVNIVHIAQHYASTLLKNYEYCQFHPESLDYLGIDRAVLEERLALVQ